MQIGGPPSGTGFDFWFEDPPNVPGTAIRSQLLYTAAEIAAGGGGAGQIQALWWLPWNGVGTLGVQSFTQVRVMLDNTGLATLTIGDNMDTNLSGLQTTVYNGVYAIPGTVANGVRRRHRRTWRRFRIGVPCRLAFHFIASHTAGTPVLRSLYLAAPVVETDDLARPAHGYGAESAQPRAR